MIAVEYCRSFDVDRVDTVALTTTAIEAFNFVLDRHAVDLVQALVFSSRVK